MNRKKRRLNYQRNNQRVHELEHELEIKTEELRWQMELVEEEKKRLRTAGLDPDREYRDGLTTKNVTASAELPEELRSVAFGNYAVLSEELDSEDMAQVKKRLVEGLVTGMIKENLVRFIYKPADDVPIWNNYHTMAARIDVVPWEQITETKTKGGKPFERETSGENETAD